MEREAFRVMAWSPRTKMWTVRGKTHPAREDAVAAARTLRAEGLRVRIQPTTTTVVEVKPAVYNAARTFREEQAMRQIEERDSKKYYKSPG